MLTINLEQIIADINNRRNRVRYQFQEIALMLTEKLNDPRHKSLYMKLAKNEEQELLMDALHYVTAGNLHGNLGAIFMWKLKELKSRPLFPLALRFEVDGGYFKVGTISEAVRGDMPLLVAALAEYSKDHAEELSIKEFQIRSEISVSVTSPFPSLVSELSSFLAEFKRKLHIILLPVWGWSSPSRVAMPQSNLMGILKVGSPQLTKRAVSRRMPSN